MLVSPSGQRREAAGAAILRLPAAPHRQSERNPRAARWLERMTRGLRDESGGVPKCSTGCDRESDKRGPRA